MEASGQIDNTLVIYTSDHGDHNGDRGSWTKMTLYDASAAVPMIVSGPDTPRGRTVSTPASLVEIYPTILSAVGLECDREQRSGFDLRELAGRDDYDRVILSEYHDGGSPTGMFMLRNARWKYNYYPGYSPELFDMCEDPGELVDLGEGSDHREIRAKCHAQMLELVDPEAANRQAFADQAARIAELGGIDSIVKSTEFDFTPVPTA